MPVDRIVAIDMDDMGLWSMTAVDCPANALKAQLGEKPLRCRAGMSTKMQGAVPLAKCKWLVGGIEDVGGKPVAHCSFGDEAPKGDSDARHHTTD